MKPKHIPAAEAAELRRQAEDHLKAQPTDADPAQSVVHTQRTLHELQVHQIELGTQNEELRQVRDKLEVEREKYSDLYDFAPVGYLTLDRKGSIGETNLACASLLGIERSRLVNLRFGRFVSEADRPAFNGFVEKVFESKTRESCEASLLREGKPPVEVNMEAVATASGRGVRVAVTDITERKRAEADRLILSKLESTGILAGGIAHDFNNLLTVILVNLDLSRMLLPAAEELGRHLEQAKSAVLLARGLTQQLITFAKGGAPVRKATTLSPIIRESARLGLSGSNVQCEFTIEDDLWPAEVDAGQVAQVIRNLVQNAREAMPEGGIVSIHAENRAPGSREGSVLPAGDYVRISITDQGGGIAKEALSKIFDPYFSTKERGEQKGMGLGLTISHSIIQQHGGMLTVESTAGVETTFTICLPAIRTALASEKAVKSKQLPRHGRILLMDDEEGIRKVVGVTLRRMGYEVELVEDGQKAIDAYRSAKEAALPFDAVILDLTVRAGLGGQETIQALRQLDPNVKAIVMSGYASDPVMLEHQHHGFRSALAKPFIVGELEEALSRVMGL